MSNIVKANTLNSVDTAMLDRQVEDFSENTPRLPLSDFTIDCDVIGVKPADYYDSKAIEVTVRVKSSNIPELKPGKEYVDQFFIVHPSIPKIVIDKRQLELRKYMACLAGQDWQDASFKPSSVIAAFAKEVNEVAIPVRVQRKTMGYTRNQKPKLEDAYERRVA